MSTKPRKKQLRITMFLNNTPMTRKRRRELDAGLGAGDDPAGADQSSAGVEEPPIRSRKRAKRSSNATPKQTPAGKGKARLRQGDANSNEEARQPGPSKPPAHRVVTGTRRAGKLPTPESEDVLRDDLSEDSAVSSLKTPLAELKLGVRRGSMETPLLQRRGLRSFKDVGLPTPLPSSPGISKSKTNGPPKILARASPEPPDEPIIISSSPLSPLTELPDSSRSQTPAHPSSPVFKVPALPLRTPHRQRVENRKPGPNPPSNYAMAVDLDEVPTSQSQDLRPFIVSPPRPGGSALFKDTTPKPLRESQGYVPQQTQPLPSVLAAIQARGLTETHDTDIVPTSQMEEAELQIPSFIRTGQSRDPNSSPSKQDKDNLNRRGLPSPERTEILRTPTKVTGLPCDGKVHIVSPVASGLLRSPRRNPPAGPSTTPLPPSSIPLSTNTYKSSRDDAALDFVQYQATPTKRRSSLDSPAKSLKLFESQTTLSPTWSQPRSFERWRLRDFLDGQRAFGSGKAGLEAEAEGREPGGESEELENAPAMASSVTEAESQDMVPWLLENNPGTTYGGKAPPRSSPPKPSKPGPDSVKNDGNENGSGSRVEQVGIIEIDDTPPPSQNSQKSDDSADRHIEDVGMIPPVGNTQSSLTESDSQSAGSGRGQSQEESHPGGLDESDLVFSQPTLDPLRAFLDIFEGGSSIPQDSQSVIDIDD